MANPEIEINHMNNRFNANGKVGTKANFFSNAMDEYDSLENIVEGMGNKIAQQFVYGIDSANNPLSALFMSDAISEGEGIQETIVFRGDADEGNPKAGADYALGFADSHAQTFYQTLNYSKTYKKSIPRDEIRKASLGGSFADNVGNALIGTLAVAFGDDLESKISKVLTSNIENTGTIDMTDPNTVRKEIRKRVTDMSKKGDTYLGSVRKADGTYEKVHYADSKPSTLMVIMPKEMDDFLEYDEGNIFHPDKVGFSAMKVLVDDLATPVTTAEASAGNWIPPVGVDKAKPSIVICDSRFVRFAPFINNFTMSTQQNNGANPPFTNFFLHAQGLIGASMFRKSYAIVGE